MFHAYAHEPLGSKGLTGTKGLDDSTNRQSIRVEKIGK